MQLNFFRLERISVHKHVLKHLFPFVKGIIYTWDHTGRICIPMASSPANLKGHDYTSLGAMEVGEVGLNFPCHLESPTLLSLHSLDGIAS